MVSPTGGYRSEIAQEIPVCGECGEKLGSGANRLDKVRVDKRVVAILKEARQSYEYHERKEKREPTPSPKLVQPAKLKGTPIVAKPNPAMPVQPVKEEVIVKGKSVLKNGFKK